MNEENRKLREKEKYTKQRGEKYVLTSLQSQQKANNSIDKLRLLTESQKLNQNRGEANETATVAIKLN